MQSFLVILAITVEEGTSKKTGQAFRIPKAQCVLRNDDQSVAAVGVLNIPKALEEVAKPGLFTGTFALVASTYGESKGEIVARLTGLVAVPPSALRKGAPVSACYGAADLLVWLSGLRPCAGRGPVAQR